MDAVQNKAFPLAGLLTNVNPQNLIKPKVASGCLLSIVMVQGSAKLSLNLSKPDIAHRGMMTNDDILAAFAGAQILTNLKVFSSFKAGRSVQMRKAGITTPANASSSFSRRGDVEGFETSTYTREGEFSEAIKKGSEIIATQIDNYECFVIHLSLSQRCISLRAISTSLVIASPAFVPISSTCARALSDESKGFMSVPAVSRRVISILAADTKKPAMLSPSLLTRSIPSITSCGIRMFLSCDLVLIFPVAIFPPKLTLVCERYIIGCVFKTIDMNTHHKLKSIHTLSTTKEQVRHKNSEAQWCANTNRASDHNVIRSNDMADQQHTQTRHKFTWRFLAINRHDKKAKPCRLSVEAGTEREARRILSPHFILSLSARIPVLEVAV